MAYQSQQISVVDLSKGIDQRSAPNAIPEGFSEDLQNVITNSNGFLAKRPGYEGYYGFLPIRVKSISHLGTSITFTLDASINVGNSVSSPIVVYGKLSSAQSGDFTTTSAGRYYTVFNNEIRSTLTAPSDTETVAHSLATDEVFLQISQSTDNSNNDNTWIIPDVLSISTLGNNDVEVTGTIPTDVNFFTMISNPDEIYVHPDQTIASGATTAITIAAATHLLSNYNIIPHVYYLDSNKYIRLEMPDITVNSTTGAVVTTITNSTGSSMDVRVVLTTADPADVDTKTVNASTTDTIVISTTEPFNFFALYNTVGAVNTLVIPDGVVYDASAETLTITINNSSVSAESYRVFWQPVEIVSSQLTVTDTGAVSATYTDSAPQLTLWGISHENLYNTDLYQEGHVNLIDTYRTDTQTRVMAGLGGNLFSAQTRDELDTAYKVPSYAIDIEGQLASDVILAPLFASTGDAADRTAGNVLADDVVANQALVTAVEFVSDGVIKYTLSLTNKSGSLASIVTTSATADRLTVTGMANDVNNGTFKITAVDNSLNTITVSNSVITFAGFNETGAMGRAGVFTDRLTLSANSKLQVGDTFTDSVFSGFSPTVLTSSSTTVVLAGITDRAFITTGSVLYPTREASVLPMISSMANFVKGDMATIGSIARKVRVISVNNNSDLTISSITAASSVATVVTSTAHGLQAGDKVVLLRTGVASYDSEQTLVSIPDSTSFIFATTSTDSSATGVVLGKTVAIDEAIDVQDSPVDPDMLSVVGRWIPAEAPTTTDTLPKTTYIKHFTAKDYQKQEPLRGTMVNDNLYMTDYYDEVLKFDGTSIYQAGLIRWQPQLFSQVNTATASIPLSGVKANPSAISGNKFTVATGEAAQFSVGDIFSHSGYTYTVQSVDTVNNLIYSTLSASSTDATVDMFKVTRYKYYFRLNAIDHNDNIIASAATGSNDFVVDLTAAGQIHIRLVGMPVWGNYDYDTLELEVYRTAAASSGPFYRVAVKDISFSAGYGYLDFKDGVADEFLSAVDPVSTAVGLGAGVGTGWSAPLRAKYITSLDNRLVLGNVKSYPELDIVMRATNNLGGITASNLSGKKFRFKKDTTSSATTTDMVNIANYEFVNSGAVTITPASDIAVTSTTFTVTKATHGLLAGDWVYMYHAAIAADNELNLAGWFQIASAATNTFTVNFSNHGRSVNAAATDVDTYVAATAQEDIPVWIGTDGSRCVVGSNTINEFTAMGRLADAINASMRITDVVLAPTFIPWMTAAAGNDLGIGRVLIKQEKVLTTTLSVVLPASTTNANYYVKGIVRAASAEVDASETLYQSRVLISYRSNPELFDNPTGDEISGTSVIDINSADGQEITGVIPFFGDSVFGQGTSESVLVVFKTNSIYLVDTTTRNKSKIQSRGLGCTAPDSIAPTRDGIMFVNNSGIYKLNRDQSISYVGAAVERIFKDEVNTDRLADFRGHQYGVGGQYKLSVPVGSSQTRNNQVLVLDHQGEQAAWTRFTNHPATGWTNLASDAFFGTSNGQVFKIRVAGDSTDFRDDADAVDDMIILLRANALGAPGSRKIIFNIVSHFQLRTTSMVGTELLSSADLDGDFVSAGTFTLTKGARNKAESVKSSLQTRRLSYIQLKYINSTKDEDVILAGVEYTAALLNVKGINEQAETT